MKISVEEIKKTAKLAKFDITAQEAALYAQQMSAVLDWVDDLQKADTSAVNEEDFNTLPAPLRADIAAQSPAQPAIVAAFNDKEGNLLKVKKVL